LMTALRSSNVKDFLEIKDFMQRLNSVGTVEAISMDANGT